MKTLKNLLALTLALVMVFSLVACGQSKAPSTNADAGSSNAPAADAGSAEPTTIYFCNYAVLETAHTDYWNQLIADFEAAHPEYKVEVVSAAYNDVMTYVTTRVGGGERVDLMLGEVTWNSILASNGVTSPVNEVLDEEFLSQFDSSVMDCYNYDGECYGIPMYISNLIVYANKNYLEQAGLDYTNPPKTSDELLQ